MGKPIEVIEPPKKVWKKPTAEDLKKIAAKFKGLTNDGGYEETDRLLDGLYFLQAAHDLGFELSDADSEKVRELVEKRLEREEKREQARLDKGFQEAIQRIVYACSSCQSADIRPRFTEHHYYPDNPVIGGRNSSSHWQTLDFLYCGSCNLVFFSEKLEELEKLWASGEFTAKSRLPKRRRRC